MRWFLVWRGFVIWRDGLLRVIIRMRRVLMPLYERRMPTNVAHGAYHSFPHLTSHMSSVRLERRRPPRCKIPDSFSDPEEMDFSKSICALQCLRLDPIAWMSRTANILTTC